MVEKSIRATLPTGPGQRHRCLFEFARWLKSHPAIAEAPAQMLRPYVKRWHSRAKAMISTKPFEYTLFDFLESWDKVTTPKGAGAMATLLQCAAASDCPAAASDYEQDKLKLLVAFCRELQQQAGNATFFLSVSTVSELFDISRRHASRWLNGLVLDEVLELVEKGDYKTRRASLYRYLGD